MFSRRLMRWMPYHISRFSEGQRGEPPLYMVLSMNVCSPSSKCIWIYKLIVVKSQGTSQCHTRRTAGHPQSLYYVEYSTWDRIRSHRASKGTPNHQLYLPSSRVHLGHPSWTKNMASKCYSTANNVVTSTAFPRWCDCNWYLGSTSPACVSRIPTYSLPLPCRSVAKNPSSLGLHGRIRRAWLWQRSQDLLVNWSSPSIYSSRVIPFISGNSWWYSMSWYCRDGKELFPESFDCSKGHGHWIS